MSRASSPSDAFKDMGRKESKDDSSDTDTPHSLHGQDELYEEVYEPTLEVGNEKQIDPTALEKVISAKPSVNSVRAIPNGGLVAWLQVLGAFFLFFNTFGIVNTFGSYQTYYESGLLAAETASDISWIGSVQATLLMLVGSLTGPIYDAGYVHHLLFTGSALVVLGQMTLSACSQYWQVMLAQGICIGVGAGCLFVPAVGILSTYFSTRVATAMGIAATGSSIGGVIYPIVFFRLQPRIGFPWATRVIGFIALATLLLSNCVMRVRVLPAGRRGIFDVSAWKEPPYVLFVMGTLVGFIGIYVPFFYIQSYAIQTGIMTPDLGFYLLSVLNAASTFGRLIPNYVADRVGPFNVMIPCTFLSGVICICLIPAHSTGAVFALAALFGFTSGTFVSLPPTVFVRISGHARNKIGTRMGMGFAFTSLGLLSGTPASGAVLDASSFTYTWVFGGVAIVIGACFILAARISWAGWSLRKVA